MSKKGTGEPVQTFCPVVTYWRFGCSEVYIIKGKLNAHLKDACSLKNTDIPPINLVCCGLQYLQNKPSQDFCYLLKKTLQSFWPLSSFHCKALAEVVTKSHSHSTVESGSVFECLHEKF